MLLTIQNLTFKYPEEERPALNGVSFSVPDGSFVTLCGVSGCGKSTLLRMLKPCLQPHGVLSGDIFFDGKPLSALPPDSAAREIGFVAQNPEAQIVSDRVWHEAAFGLESVGTDSSELRRRVAECAEYFGLERLFDSETANLSGGEKQLLALASAAALHPRLLLLDEPTSQLDPISAQGFIDTAQRLNRDFGITVLIAEHRLEELLPVSDSVIVMDCGRIIANCPPRGIAAELPENHPMRAALPAASRIYSLAVKQSNAPEDLPPLTVREGRNSPLCRSYLKSNAPCRGTEHTPDGKPILTVRELWVSYGKHQPDALKSASLSLYKGQIYALLGGNGSGKTTLLKAVAGIVKPLGGRSKLQKGMRLAYLPQNPCAILGQDSALGEMTARGISESRAREVLKRFGMIGELLGRNPFDLSGGEQQRLALAALIAGEPDLLLTDEPTKGMDAAAKRDFAEMLRHEASAGMAVLLVTHDTEFAALCADKCGLLFNGEIVSESSPETFFSENYFYTTPLCRMAKGITDGWI